MTTMVVWSLFFLISLCFSCSGTEGSDDFDVLSNEINQMHICQRKADNKEFFLHKYRADKLLKKYDKHSGELSDKKQIKLTQARSRYSFVLTDYLLQVGNRKEATLVMDALASNSTLNISTDTLLWLNYLCHQAEVNLWSYNIEKNRNSILKGYDCLIQGYILASRRGYNLYKGIAMKLMSRYMLNDSIYSLIKDFDPASVRYVNEDGVPDSLLAGNLAERSLNLFLNENDAYQTADAWRTLAFCYFVIGDAEQSVECLHMAFANPIIDSIPALKANIAQQMSMAYSALDDKHNSDVYRNKYLDIQDSIRQDRQFEARATELEKSVSKIWYSVSIAVILFLLLCMLSILLVHLRKRKERKADIQEEEIEALEEELSSLRLQYSDAQRLAVEQKARISIINGMLPLIDRMRIAVSKNQMEYAGELATAIEEQNEMLSTWIKLRKGSISPKVETFDIQEILDIVRQNAINLANQGIQLHVAPCNAQIKADKILTLFIVNTLIDNARKAVNAQEGEINVTCQPDENEGFAEIAVKDNGRGMSQEQLDHLFEYKNIKDDANETSHGFGLQNCRGIIDRYHKISSLFSVCSINAKSKLGAGTTISFRLPLALKMLVLFFCLSFNSHAGNIERYADSLYYCNINGKYAEAMLYADSCKALLENGDTINDRLMLSVYNETAVAALALHDWRTYLLNNYLYAKLYKECTTDASLPEYCGRLERNKRIANISMIVAMLLILSLAPIFWFTYLRYIVRQHRDIRSRKTLLREEIAKTKGKYDALHVINNVLDNQLSTIKHETMYYPSRIKQLIKQETNEQTSQVKDVVSYYRELYALLCLQVLNNQTTAMSFPIEKIDIDTLFPSADISQMPDGAQILANKELMAFLKLLLKRHNAKKTPSCTIRTENDKYAIATFQMDSSPLSSDKSLILFSPSTPDADFLIMRQILRETGEASLRYGCGISASNNGNGTLEIDVRLPYVCK